MHEQWKPVIGYADLYEVSDHGRVRTLKPSKRFPAGHVLTPFPKGPYLTVKLYRTGKGRTFRIHDIAAPPFIGPRPAGYVVNHKDLNKRNNRATNFEYITQKQNVQHAIAGGHFSPPPVRCGSEHGRAKVTESDIRTIRTRRSAGETLAGIKADYPISVRMVSMICRREAWGHVA